MPECSVIYGRHADQYDALVSREDYQHNLLPALNEVASFDGQTVVELGAGTGRLTCMLAPRVKAIYAFDSSQHMLEFASAKLQKLDRANWRVAISDHRNVSIEDATADLVISGWSVCYIVVGNEGTGADELSKALAEMRRILRPGGVIVLLETLGTGCEHPTPPPPLVRYFDFLEESGFQRRWLRTDYRFRDRAEGETLTRFFFGDGMVEKIVQDDRGVILPECTGIWWARREGVTFAMGRA